MSLNKVFTPVVLVAAAFSVGAGLGVIVFPPQTAEADVPLRPGYKLEERENYCGNYVCAAIEKGIKRNQSDTAPRIYTSPAPDAFIG